MLIEMQDGGVFVTLEVIDEAPVRLLHVGAFAFDPSSIPEDRRWTYRLVELRAAGEDHAYIEAGRYAGSALGERLRYVSHKKNGHALTVVQRDSVTGLATTTELVLMEGALDCRTQVVNGGSRDIHLQSVSSIFLNGFCKGGTLPASLRTVVHVPRNGWYAEFQWTRHTGNDLGFNSRWGFSSRHETFRSVGPWCSSNYLPMGALENSETGEHLIWEILHGGSWSAQLGEAGGEIYLHLAGPTEAESEWSMRLAAGDGFSAVPCVLAPAASFDEGIAALTRHRRRTRLAPIQSSPVVFNDYMNCLMGDPSEAAIMPLIETAASAGAEIYCIDAGWYAHPGVRWSETLGNWTVNAQRFPNGLKPVFDRIRELGMIPGIWFEIEGVTKDFADREQLPRDWFFERHGEPVLSHRRLQLDFRNPAVREFASNALGQMIEIGGRFFKLDCNFNSGAGSDLGGSNVGQSLLDYETAFLSWLDDMRRRWPTLLLEHCASGGMRLGRPYLDRMHTASNSDEGSPRQIARIASAGPAMLLPEQNGCWALPQRTDSVEAVAFTMAATLLGRVHLAGRTDQLGAEQAALVREAISFHKRIRDDLRSMVPFWPLGLPAYHDDWICFGLRGADESFLAVFYRGDQPGRTSISIGLQAATLAYPMSSAAEWRQEGSELQLAMSGEMACIFRLA
jgi:alpha-galactosidase